MMNAAVPNPASLSTAELVARREEFFDRLLTNSDRAYLDGALFLKNDKSGDLWFRNLCAACERTQKAVWMLEEDVLSIADAWRRGDETGDRRLTFLRQKKYLEIDNETKQEQESSSLGMLHVCMQNTQKKFVFFTSNADLAGQLNKVTELESVSCRFSVYNIDSYGFPCRFKPAVQPAAPMFRPRAGGDIARFVQQGEPFADNKPIPAPACGTGSILNSSDGRQLTLGERIDHGNEGNEAAVYAIEGDDSFVAKIFFSPTMNKAKKTALLCRRSFDIEGVYFPSALLTSEDHRFVGYIMPRINNGVPLEGLFDCYSQMEKAPHWNRTDFIRAAQAYLRIVLALHEKGMMIGDVTPRNIHVLCNEQGLLDGSRLVLFDTDSFQFGFGNVLYPSDGMSDDYAPADLLQDGWEPGTVRDISGESFSAALLAVQMLMAGIHPYLSQSSSADDSYAIKDCIRAGLFAYGVGSMRRDAMSPDGAEKLWSQMSYGVKKAAHDALAQKEGVSCSLKELLKQVDHYLAWIQDPRSIEKYGESILDLDPITFKVMRVQCSGCGKWFDSANEHGVGVDNVHLCPDCAQKPVAYCTECKTAVTLTAAQKLLGKHALSRCKQCHELWLTRVKGPAVCEECGSIFNITNGESKDPPACCPVCREKAAAAVHPVTARPVHVTAQPITIQPAPASVPPVQPARPAVQPIVVQPSADPDRPAQQTVRPAQQSARPVQRTRKAPPPSLRHKMLDFLESLF